MLDDFRDAAHVRGYRHNFRCHCLERRQAKRFQLTRHEQNIGDGQSLIDLFALPEKDHIVVDTLLHGEPLCRRAVRAITHEQQLRRNLFADTIKHFDYIRDSLHRPEIGHVNKNSLAIGRILLAPLSKILVARIHIAINKVVDDLDVVLHVELAHRSLAQILCDGGDSIALFDRVTRDWQVRTVLPYQRDVSSVKRCDEGQLAFLWSCGQHLPREHCAYRMRDGVMHVK